MTVIEHPAHQLSAAARASAGQPGADGRWQPTRAGVVNSWAWAEETLLFADGWLALTGPNGSGKSLTASMLITMLLDGDVSQKALSVSGTAAGTLASRHTDRNEREDRTGVWWLEYGFRYPETGLISYLTTGLWLRSSSGDLQRAFFIASGRVGSDLILQRDREPVRIEDLAQQLASCEGELFTSSARILSRAQAHLDAVAEEAGYRRRVRTRLFAPLEEVQFDALMSVLRSLRSVRTAEQISPNQMRAVLSDALPALDPENLTVIAESMERIADLEKQLQDTRAEAAVLGSTDQVYRRYLTAIAQLAAAALSAANNDVDDQTRQEREAASSLKSAETAREELGRRHDVAGRQISELEGHRDAADTVLRDHAGAELPHLEQRAADAAREAQEAAVRAQEAREEAGAAEAAARDSARTALDSQQHLAELTGHMRAETAVLHADAAADRLLAMGNDLAATQPRTIAGSDINQVSATPLAWVEARQGQIRTVQAALREHSRAQQAELTAAQAARAAEDREDAQSRAADASTGHRQAAEQIFSSALAEWSAVARHLGPVPEELTAPDERTGTDRLEPDRLATWLSQAAQTAREHIGLADLAQSARTAAEVALARDEISQHAASEHATAVRAASDAEDAHASALTTARAEEAADNAARTQAHHEHEQAIYSATTDLAAARQSHSDAVTYGRQTTRDWISQVRSWRDSLVHLSITEQDVPSAGAGPAELDDLTPEHFRQSAADAHAGTASRLQRAAAVAGQRLRRAEEAVTKAEGTLADARSAGPVPAEPPWRTRGPDDGIPLWELVDFARQLSTAQADQVEGALLVSGLLDALVSPDGRAVAGDLVITPDRPAEGRTLADVLQVDPEHAIDPDQVRRLLSAIPVDQPGSDVLAGRLANGVLTASAPVGYQAAFIGRSARERARLGRVAALEAHLVTANQELESARTEVQRYETGLQEAAGELGAFPSADMIGAARGEVSRLKLALSATETLVTERVGQADLALQKVLGELDNASTERSAALAAAESAMNHAQRAAAEAAARAKAAATAADEQAGKARASERLREQAARAQAEADTEQESFPQHQLEHIRAAHLAEDEATADLNHARAGLVEATEQHRHAGEEVRKTLRALNAAASLPGGWLLPTTDQALDEHRDSVGNLGHLVTTWTSAARRVRELLVTSERDASIAARRVSAASKSAAQADSRQLASTRHAAAVAEARKLYGAEYQTLLENRQHILDALQVASALAAKLQQDQIDAAGTAQAARAQLANIAPQRERAELHRDQCLRNLGRLVEEGLAVLPDDMPAGPTGGPANLTAALTWARRMLADRPAATDRMTVLTQARDRNLTQLENSVRSASAAMARFGRQVTLISIEGTEWRRAIVADPEATRGDDLHLAVAALQAAAGQLESDLRDDVMHAMKTGLFTKLQQDIQLHREAAQELVRKIRQTLAGVRTGVANVGVEVDWQVRKDEDARRMVELISQPPSDEVYEQMYALLRQRMDETAGEEWKARIEHTFDYRSWHDWEIKVTHSSFDHDGQEKFREVTPRSNPLDSLSTGERRLATMLPLLAAAWSMYSGDYHGPRLLSIDEIDAAFDEPNLRQVLTLLRTWAFDVLATAPSMTPIFKREAGRAIVHQVVASGKHRVTVPWMWEGHGEPLPLALDFGGHAARRQS